MPQEMTKTTEKPDLCIIGAGSGGLSVAAGAAQMGASVVLIERGKMGGDCLNTGCVPSKALLAAAKHAHSARSGAAFGIKSIEPQVNFSEVMDHVQSVIASIAPNDSVERFEGLGIQVVQASARFVDAQTVEAGGQIFRPRRFVVATGSRAFVPPIPGIFEVPHFTNESIFENRSCPEHLIILGGGPIGAEMAQAHVRLGARVTIVEMAKILSKDDPELTSIVRQALVDDGVDVREDTKALQVAAGAQGGVRVEVEGPEGRAWLEGSHLLVATGRRANIEDLNLEAAGITTSKYGIEVDASLKTSNSKVYAIGDVAGGLQFTHVAGYHAGIVIRQALFRMPARADAIVPWVTYTDPELAHVGLSEAAAGAEGQAVQVLNWPFAENDRARAERRTEGLIKVVVDKRGRILGASIVGPGAGELILPWVLAISEKRKISSMANIVAAYPTFSEVSKRVAGSYYTKALFSPRAQFFVRLLAKFG